MSEVRIRSGNRQIDALSPRIRGFLEQDLSEYNLMGKKVRGYRSPDSPSIWLRDHSDMLRGGKYWEKDLTSAIEHFAETQTERGWLYDYFSMIPEKTPCEQENWAKYVRVPVEADVEYRFVKAVFLAWQATGDDRWLKSMLPRMEKALDYILTDEWRWDRKHRLVKRGYCIDTWDFDYTAGRHPWLNFQITDHTFWGIMHGDNSGYYEAFQKMSLLYDYLGKKNRARRWAKFAEGFRKRANRLCFNGRFYTHHVPLVPVTIPEVEESQQLSLSNPMDINRGLATHAMAVKILSEYRRRGEEKNTFAEWFSIDPPFPDGIFGDKKLVAGAYCNGGIMPLVGGELARAAFEHGFEEYALRQLIRYEELTRSNESYLWYFPDGRHATPETSTSPEAMPTDGWGSSAMLYALVEGLAGIVDEQKLFRHVRLSPRWVAAGSQEASVSVAYGPSGAGFEYAFAHDAGKKTVELDIRARASVSLHLLLPHGARAKNVRIFDKGRDKGRKADRLNRKVEESSYVDVEIPVKKRARVLVEYS